MRRRFASAWIVAVALAVFATGPAVAQGGGQLPQPPIPFQPPPPPPPPPIKPYKAVTVTPAGPFNDASFIAFRSTLAGIAKSKDRAGLAKQIAAKDFFWVQDHNIADPHKSGIDNLAKAIGLDNPNGSGWKTIADAAADPTLMELPNNTGLYCAPAAPTFDRQGFANLVENTDTQPTDWGYPSRADVEVRAAGQPNAAVVEKLGNYFVRVLPDSAAPKPGAPFFLHIALPDGKTGYVPLDGLMPLASDKICYAKEDGDWKIVGYVGGVPQ
jgi:hypothetical protein